MIYKYNELKIKKQSGEELKWEEITKEQLASLFLNESIPDSVISDLYNITKNKVRYQRKKWDISLNSADYIYKKFKESNNETFRKMNNNSKNRIMARENIDWVSKAIAYYVFREGPIEDMHSNNQLSQKDMKLLNKTISNKLAGLLELVIDNDWQKLELLLNFTAMFTKNWDKVEIDTSEVDELLRFKLSSK